MSIVDPHAKDEMARILRAMTEIQHSDDDGAEDDGFVSYDPTLTEGYVAPARATSSPEIDAMRQILERFHAAETATPVINESAEYREALAIAPTPTGTKIGAWEIIKEAGSPNTYDVVHSLSRAPIASNLYLYDAALGLVRHLNEGVSITDHRIKDLLTLEENYARNRDDAVSYKQRAKKHRENDDVKRAAIAEDRFDEATRQAIDARDRILRLAGLR
jgi:hypothetical protein